MTKNEFVVQIAKKTGLAKDVVDTVVKAFCEVTETSLKNGDSIRLKGFGIFSTRERAAGSGRNLLTGERVEVPATVVPVFKAGRTFRRKVNNK